MCMRRFGSPVIFEQRSFFDRFDSLPSNVQKDIEEMYGIYLTDIAPILRKNLDSIKAVFDEESFIPSDMHSFHMAMLFILQCRDNSSIDEVILRANTDVGYQYVLLSTSEFNKPVISRSYYSLFLSCMARYDKKHDFCLMEKIFTDFTDAAALEMGINLHQDLGDVLRTRIDSMLIDTPAAHLSRAGIIYRTNSMCLDLLASVEGLAVIPEYLHHYLAEDDENAVIYHNRGEAKMEKLKGLLTDSLEIQKLMKNYKEYEEFELLGRVIGDQGILQDDGSIIPKIDKEIEGGSVQSPYYPPATCRKKYGYQIGEACCFTEASTGTASILTEVLFGKNITSDDDFMMEHMKRKDPNGPMEVCSCDAGFFSMNLAYTGQEVRVLLLPSALKWTQSNPLMADFVMDETGTKVLTCPAGHAPIPGMQRFSATKGEVNAKFDRATCEACEYRDRCPAKAQVRAYSVDVSQSKIDLAEQILAVDTEEYKEYARFRNAIESVPSVMRRTYGFDTLRSMNISLRKEKIFGASINYNVKKLIAFRQNRDKAKAQAA